MTDPFPHETGNDAPWGETRWSGLPISSEWNQTTLVEVSSKEAAAAEQD